MIFYTKQGNTSPGLLFQALRIDGTPIDFDGSENVTFSMVFVETGIKTVDDAAAAIILPNALRYDWQAGQTDNPGLYHAEFTVTYSDGSVETFPNLGYLDIHITAQL